METYNTVTEYINNGNKGDRIVLDGRGIMSGLKNLSSKHDTHRVTHIDRDKNSLTMKVYRGKKPLTIGRGFYDQKVGVLSDAEYKELPTLW